MIKYLKQDQYINCRACGNQ